ncbi:hypothetical protein H0E87_022834 [Populus deltoides]|uniref:Late embryogenesis abundant protein LEA-2 subgroup domain-containing protein n=1 Tax=Populus deltoides TaxID=3696 RepID=A0A8T2XA34_POPDE|nr:hypothetical protein H0E87_022834 [Populus deltoides]
MNTTSSLVHDNITKNFSRRMNGYQPLDRYDSMHSNDPHDMGYRTARAKQRQVFLKSYRLASITKLRRRSRSLKLKKVVAKAAMGTAPEYQPNYVMLNYNNSSSVRPPPQRRNIPSVIAFIYMTLNPKMPEYNVASFDVNAFNMAPDFSLYTEFAVTVKANNPNTGISFIYGKESSVVVAYSDSTLCSGKLPAFHQPGVNTTMIQVVLKGKSEFGSGLQEVLMDNRETGKIPLLVMVNAPVSVVLKSFPLREVIVNVNCSLVVDNLSPNKRVRILSSEYAYAVNGMKLQM